MHMHNNKHTSPVSAMMKRYGRLIGVLAAALTGIALSAQPATAATAVRTSGFVYDAATGLLTKEIIEPGDPNLCLVTEYTYDVYGNKTSVTTRNCNGSAGEAAAPAAGSDAVIPPRTTTSTAAYNADGSVTTVVANALGHTETKVYRASDGNVISVTGPNGLTTAWTYDNWGRKTLESRADGTTTAWSYVWGNGGSTAQPNIRYYIATTVSGQANPVYDYFDSLSRKVLSSHRNFANTDWVDEGNVVMDNAGRVVKNYLPYERAAFTSAKFSTVSYDVIGRAVSQTAPDGSTASTTFSGLTTVITNALGQAKTTVKNAAGQTASITDAQGNLLTYTYDAFGNMLTTTDAAGNVTRLTYDARGRKTGMNDPDMGVWSYAYNALGELIRQVDAKGQTVTMTYDKLGRMLTRNEPDLISAWVYDTAANGKGKLATASAANGYSRSHTYDTLGRPVSTTTTPGTGEPALVTSVTYDAFGRVLTETYPTGFAVKNIYNADGHLVQIANAATNAVLWTANSMDAMGHLLQQTYGNGVVTTQVFDPATGKLKQQLAGAGNAIQNTSYTYDSLGNLTTRTDAANNLTETYTYDSLNRIVTASALSGAVNTLNSYSYNAIGNITAQSKKDVTANTFIYNYAYTYNASGANSVRPHAVASVTGSVYGVTNPVYTYDANGSMLSGAGRSVVWTSFNMPSQMTGCPNGGAACSTVGFTYNPEHERVREVQADGSVVITLSPRYDTGLHFEKKYITANKIATGAIEYEHYLYAGGMMIGKYITTTATDGVTIATTATEYYVKDHLGSIVARLDGTGAVIERLSFDVFGARRYPNGAADPNGLLNNPDMYHGYTGHEMLDAVGLIHMNGRIFDPVTGRFLSADPNIQSPDILQSYNRYSYCWNNPYACTDPSGYFSLGDVLKTVAAIVVTVYAGPALAAYFYGAMAGGMSAAAAGAVISAGTASTGMLMVAGAMSGAVVGGVVAGIMSGGDMNAIRSGMLSGAIGGALFAGAGQVGGPDGADSLGRYAAHAAAGCVSAVADGGKCGRGAASAVAGKWVTNHTQNWQMGPQFAAAAIAGGVTSALGGGKFANGAVTAAMGYLFNCRLHPGACTPDEIRADAKASWEEETRKTLAQIDSVKNFVRGLTGIDGKEALSNSLKVVSDGADYVTAVALVTPGGVVAAAVASQVSLYSGLASAALSSDLVRNSLPIAAGEYAARGSSALGARGKLAIGLGLVTQKRVDSVVNP